MQSPIEVHADLATPMHYMPFKFTNYEAPISCNLRSEQDTLFLDVLPENLKIPSVTGGGLFHEYQLYKIQFRWPAEHEVNFVKHPLEVQLIHFAKKFETVANALNYKDGLAILSLFYSDTNDESGTKLKSIFDLVSEEIPLINKNVKGPRILRHKNPIVLTNKIIVQDFFPVKPAKYFRYQGSLTTSEYNEVVTWTLFSKPGFISKKQLRNLKDVWLECAVKLQDNFREAQDDNKRNIYLSKLACDFPGIDLKSLI